MQVEHVVQLLDEGNTVPFIARYRRERTSGLPEELIRRIRSRVGQLRHFAERKMTIAKAISRKANSATNSKRPLFLRSIPSGSKISICRTTQDEKPWPVTCANAAWSRLALAIWNRDPAMAALDEVIAGLVNPEKQLTTTEEVTAGLRRILAEIVATTANVRSVLRMILWDTGRLTCAKAETLPEARGQEYKDYFQFTEPIRMMPPHRILAINRGEKENALKVKLDFDADLVAPRPSINSRWPITRIRPSSQAS